MSRTINKGGRPPRYGEPTKPVRVPLSKLTAVQAFIDGDVGALFGEDTVMLLRVTAREADSDF